MHKIAITGATSMLGVATIKNCLSQNISVIAFVRKCCTKIERLPKSHLLTVVECDLDELENFEPIATQKNVDVFYHFGWAYTDKDGRNDAEKQYKNIGYTLASVRLAQKLMCKKFIGAGSQAEYGVTNEMLSAYTPCNPLIAYGVAKYAAGKLSRLECEKIGMEHIWLRILSVYGKNDNSQTLVSQLIYNAKNNIAMSLSNCEQIWDFLYEDDAASAFVAIGKFGVNGKTYMIGSGQGKMLREYVETLIDIVNPTYKPDYGKIPYNKNQPMHLVANISELTADTSWQPKVSFAEGIKNIISTFGL